jgi:hypothetical protein
MDTYLNVAFLLHHSISATSCRIHAYCRDLMVNFSDDTAV